MTEIRFNEYLGKIWKSEKRFLVVVAGTQGGKTEFGRHWIINEIQKDTSKDYLVASPTYKMLGQSTLPRFLEIAKNLEGRWYDQPKEYRLKGGGRVFIRSTEKPETLEAMTLGAAWLDEAGLMKWKVWEIMQSRLAVLKGKLLMTTTLYTTNWVYHTIINPWKKKARKIKQDFEIVQFESILNPKFPKEEYARLKATMPDATFRRRFGGECVKNEGLVYSEFDREKIVVPAYPIPDNWARGGGLDFGYGHPTAFVFWAHNSDKKKIVIYKTYSSTQSLISEHVEKIKEYVTEDMDIYSDPRRPDLVAEYRAEPYRLPVLAAKKVDPALRRDRIRDLIHNGKLEIFEECKDIIDEFETHSYRIDEEGKSQEEVIKTDDDCLDAFGYSWCSTFLVSPKVEVYQNEPVTELICDEDTGYPIGERENNSMELAELLHGGR